MTQLEEFVTEAKARGHYHFGLGPRVFKGDVGEDGTLNHPVCDCGPYGTNFDEMRGVPFTAEAVEQMIRAGYERVRQDVEDFRGKAREEFGIDLDAKS